VTEALYLDDGYLRAFSATVAEAGPGWAILDRSGFYPTGGGQPHDVGVLVSDGDRRWEVSSVEKSDRGIVHRLAEPAHVPEGTAVHGAIDWRRRYACMRYHSCLHILSGVVYRRFGSDITGGQIYPDRARMDLSIPGFDRRLAEDLIREVNEVVRRAHPISVRFVPLVEAERHPEWVRVERDLMPQGSEIRLIDIEGFDAQADGGTHVRTTAEVGLVSLEKIENKGARNKRLYVTVAPRDPPGE
jgi:misacylated tRNA(Ala) deacylase